MKLGNSLFNARKKSGHSQEEIAAKLGVSRQTISKWETSETVPDIYQAKKLATIYNISLDELLSYDIEVKEIEEAIDKVSEKTQKEVDWTKLWGKKYPILLTYANEVDIDHYQQGLKQLLDQLQTTYKYDKTDAFLVLKDILGKLYTAQ